MNLTKKDKIYLAICVLSFIFSYLIITPNYFPHLGISLSLITFAIFSYKIKAKRNALTKKYLFFTIIFSVFLFIRSEPLITFFNLIASLTFGVLMLMPFEKENYVFLDYIYNPAIYFVKSIFGKSKYYLEHKNKKGDICSGKLLRNLAGIIISILLLAIILPVLSTVNPFFKNIVNNLWSIVNLENLLNYIGRQTIFLWLIRLTFTFGFIFLLPKLLTFTDEKLNATLPINFKKQIIPLVIPKIVVAVTLIVFFVTQLQFYFATESTLASLSLSHSEHVNEVFGQLSFVAVIVFLLIYNSKHKEKIDIFLNWLLGMQGFFLTFMAYKSDLEYINAWGLTYKRLYGLAVASWVLGIFILLFKNHIKEGLSFNFVKNSIILSAAILILVNVSNFDYLIYHFDKAATGQGVDYTYLSRLSPDSLSYEKQFIALEEATKNELSTPEYDNENPLIILHNIEKLQEKYKNLDLRTFNLFEYIQYLQVKSINTQDIRNIYTSKLSP